MLVRTCIGDELRQLVLVSSEKRFGEETFDDECEERLQRERDERMTYLICLVAFLFVFFFFFNCKKNKNKG